MKARIRGAVAAAMAALAILAAPAPVLASPGPAASPGLASAADEVVELGIPDPAGGLLTAQATCDGTRQAFLEVVGEQEARSYWSGWDNNVEYNGYNGEPWCGHFVAWCARVAGVSYDHIPGADTAKSVPRFSNWFKDRGTYHYSWDSYEPKAGDIAFLDDNGHVGVVVGRSGSDVVVREGNVGNGGANDEVQVNTYWRSGGRICGYGETWMPERVVAHAPTWDYGGDANLPSGWYSIRQVVDTGKYLEIGGGSTENGANVQIWGYQWMGMRDHIRFHLNRLDDGSYAVDTFAGKVLDVSGGSNDNGANVHQYEWNGSDAQKWYIQDCGNGVYALQTKCSGKYLDLASGGLGNGNNVQQWEYGNNNNQRWVITPCDLYGGKVDVPDGWWYIRSSINYNYAMNIIAASTENCANLQLWYLNKTIDQRFRFIANGDGSYRIEAQCSGKVLDVENESRLRGANVQQVYWKDIDCQKWYVQDAGDGRVAIQSKLSGLYLDLMWGDAKDGQNIWQYPIEGGDTPRLWYLTPAEEGTPAAVEDGTYEIVSATAEAGVVTGSAGDEYTFVSEPTGSDYQAFRLTTTGGRTRLLNVGRNAYMDVYAASLRETARVNLVGDTGTPQQHWYVEDAGGGTVSLRNDLTNLYLDVRGGVGTSGTPLQMYHGNGTAAQRFRLRRLTLDGAEVDAIPDQVPTGSAIEPALTVRFAGRVLERGRDYSVEWKNNVLSGEAAAVLAGAGNFSGALEARFRIKELRDGWVDFPDGAKGYAKGGKLVKGWMNLDGKKYRFDVEGRMLVGWQDVEDGGKTFHYYFFPSGSLARETWATIGGRQYYFRPSGNMATGWATIDDGGVAKKYYFDKSGQLLTGWQDIANSEGKTLHYYFRPSGSMATGWATIDGQKCWFRDSGNMATGFTTVDDAYKRYFDKEGHMLTGWQQIGGKTYYFRVPSGAMQTGKATIDGVEYEFTDSGALKSGTVPAQSDGLGAQGQVSADSEAISGQGDGGVTLGKDDEGAITIVPDDDEEVVELG